MFYSESLIINKKKKKKFFKPHIRKRYIILLSPLSLLSLVGHMAKPVNSLSLYKPAKLPKLNFITTMASNKIIFFLVSSLLLLLTVSAIEYTVTNKAIGNPGGVRFNNEIGVAYSRQVLVAATDFIWKIFRQRSNGDRKNVQKVSLFIVTDYDGVAFASNNEIHVSANYIANYGGDLKREITGIKLYESHHN